MTTKTIILLLLFVISVSTLLPAIFADTNQMIYAISTVVAHVCLVLFGFFYARSSNEKMLAQIRHDLLGR